MHDPSHTGGIGGAQQRTGPVDIHGLERGRVIAARIAVAEVGGGVEQNLAPGQGGREGRDVRHVALDHGDAVEAGELGFRLPG